MKIKVFIKGTFSKVLTVQVTDDVKTIANKYERWEYVL